jgi:hypothetical protein
MKSRCQLFPGVVRLCILGFLVVAFAGCLDLESEIELEESGAGTVSLRYRVDNRLMTLGTFDGPTDRPAVPISRRDFDTVLSRVEGARLESHGVRSGDELTEVSAVIAFDSVDAFNELFGRRPNALRLADDGVELVLVDAVDGETMDEDLVNAFFGENRLRFRLETPGEIVGINRGTVVEDGRAAELEIPVADAVLAVDGVVWRVDL